MREVRSVLRPDIPGCSGGLDSSGGIKYEESEYRSRSRHEAVRFGQDTFSAAHFKDSEHEECRERQTGGARTKRRRAQAVV